MKKRLIAVITILCLTAFAGCVQADSAKKAKPQTPQEKLEKLTKDYQTLLNAYGKLYQQYYAEKQQRIQAESDSFQCGIERANRTLQQFRDLVPGQEKKEKEKPAKRGGH